MATTSQIHDRRTAGSKLARKLISLGVINPVIIAIPHGGVEVGFGIAHSLNLPLSAMPCRKIADPSDKSRTIGSVSQNEVVLHNCPFSVPQDYLHFKTIQLRNEIEAEMRFYNEGLEQEPIRNKTVVLVDDVLRSSDTMIACLRDLRNQKPFRIIVCVPFVQAEAARVIQAEADDFVFLKIQPSIQSPLEFYTEFNPVDEWKVRDLLVNSRGVPIRLPETPATLVPRKAMQFNRPMGRRILKN